MEKRFFCPRADGLSALMDEAEAANHIQRNYKAGTVAVLRVDRIAEPGAFLDAGTGSPHDDILLHNNQQTRPIKVGEQLKVFLYRDPNGRLAASMRVPQLKEGQIARLKIINVDKNGAFVDVGAERGVFMPYAGMRGRPKVGEVVWAKLYTDKSGRLATTMVVDDEIRRASKPAAGVKVGDTVAGAIYNITEKGAFLFSNERYIVFIDHQEIIHRPRVGEVVHARVTYIRNDGRLNASLRPVKEAALGTDSAMIMEHLKAHNGRMPYDDNTPPDIIRMKFHLSKAAFKRALGHLIKEGVLEQADGWTRLKNFS